MPKTIEVPEYQITEHVSIDPATTALIIVDMQVDFVESDGALPVPGARASVAPIAQLLEWARQEGLFIAFTQDTHDEDDPEWEIWGRHVERNTPGWGIIPELAPIEGELVVQKARYDGFYGTGLDHALRTAAIETVIICGTVANICVHYTAASAALRWYKVVLPVDGLSALTEFDMESSLRQAEFLFGATLTTVQGITGE